MKHTPTRMVNIKGLEGLTMKQAAFVIEYCRDFNAQAAAERSGYISPTAGYDLLKLEPVQKAVNLLLANRQEAAEVDAEWLKYEMVDNHVLARQSGNLSASNKALEMLGKLASVDAFAADKLEVSGDDIIARMKRARERANEPSFI